MSQSNGRATNGRFAAGNPGGPGRPRREVEREYLDATVAAVPIDAWTAIVKRAVDDAKSGNGVARAWLSKALGIDASKIMLSDSDSDEPIDAAYEADNAVQTLIGLFGPDHWATGFIEMARKADDEKRTEQARLVAERNQIGNAGQDAQPELRRPGEHFGEKVPAAKSATPNYNQPGEIVFRSF